MAGFDLNEDMGFMSWDLHKLEKVLLTRSATTTHGPHTVPHMLDAQPFSHSPTANCFFQRCARVGDNIPVMVPVAAADELPPRPEPEMGVVPSVSVCSNDPSSDTRSRTSRLGKRRYTRRRAKKIRTSFSERKQRVKIQKKMRQLQQLLPNCNDDKVDKDSILDEAIVYLRSLQMQLVMERTLLKQLLSMQPVNNPMAAMGNYMSFPMAGFPHNNNNNASYFL